MLNYTDDIKLAFERLVTTNKKMKVIILAHLSS
jgi:hypothetical protein